MGLLKNYNPLGSKSLIFINKINPPLSGRIYNFADYKPVNNPILIVWQKILYTVLSAAATAMRLRS
jgi:hypothetical protein